MARKITEEERNKTNEEFVILQQDKPLDQDQLDECKQKAFAMGKNFDYNFQKEVIAYHKSNKELDLHIAGEIYEYCKTHTKEESIKFIFSRS